MFLCALWHIILSSLSKNTTTLSWFKNTPTSPLFFYFLVFLSTPSIRYFLKSLAPLPPHYPKPFPPSGGGDCERRRTKKNNRTRIERPRKKRNRKLSSGGNNNTKPTRSSFNGDSYRRPIEEISIEILSRLSCPSRRTTESSLRDDSVIRFVSIFHIRFFEGVRLGRTTTREE